MVDLIARLRRVPALAVRLALDQVATVAGAIAIRAAERAGHGRPEVLRAADRRVAELRGEDVTQRTEIVVAGEAVETERLLWEQARARGEARIVAAVGRGRWTGRL